MDVQLFSRGFLTSLLSQTWKGFPGLPVLVQGGVLRPSGVSIDIPQANFGNGHIWASHESSAASPEICS